MKGRKPHDLMFGCLTFPGTELQHIRTRGRYVEIPEFQINYLTFTNVIHFSSMTL